MTHATAFAMLNVSLEIGLAFAAILLTARFVSPRMRVLLYRAGFALALMSPLVLLNYAPGAALVMLPAQASPSAHAPALVLAMSPAAAALHSAPHITSLAPFAALLLIAGALIVLGRSLMSHLLLSRAFALGAPPPHAHAALLSDLSVRLGINAPVRVRISALAPAPCTFGWLRPKILAPANTSPEALESILAHELCHIRNHDALWLMFERLACALFWFNPLIWAVARRHREDIELVCDDAVTAATVSVETYLTALVQSARDLIRPNAYAAVMMSRSGLDARVRALIERKQPMPAPSNGAKLAIACATMLAAWGVSAGRLVAADPTDSAMAMLNAQGAPMQGHGLVFVDVAAHAEVAVGTTGLCSDDAHCVFEHRLGEAVELRVRTDRAGHFAWTGCAPSADAETCNVRISDTPVRVSVRLRR